MTRPTPLPSVPTFLDQMIDAYDAELGGTGHCHPSALAASLESMVRLLHPGEDRSPSAGIVSIALMAGLARQLRQRSSND
jgi:hypothetical protein